MEDAQRLFGRVSTAVQKIVKRNTKPKDIVSRQHPLTPSLPHPPTQPPTLFIHPSVS